MQVEARIKRKTDIVIKMIVLIKCKLKAINEERESKSKPKLRN